MAVAREFALEDLVVLVNSPFDRHYGRIGKVLNFDHTIAEGTWIITFADGSGGSFVDADKYLEIFYRRNDKIGEEEDKFSHGPRSFVHRYFRLTGQGKTQLNREYKTLFKEEFVLEN